MHVGAPARPRPLRRIAALSPLLPLEIMVPLILLTAGSSHAAKIQLNWVSHNGASALLGGGPFTDQSKVTLTPSSSNTAAAPAGPTTVPALDVSNAALKFQVPDATQAYDISVDGSAPLCMNLPDPWWWQGDSGNSSTPGGWLRIFGRSVGRPGKQHRQCTCVRALESLPATPATDCAVVPCRTVCAWVLAASILRL